MCTIATHNGSQVSREHNRRNPKVVSKEDHIIPDGEHETWRDISHQKAYDMIFGDALEEYNNKQKREDRKINSYYTHIKNDKTKHPVYEMIVGVYGEEVSKQTEKMILQEFYDTWDERNPNLKLIGAYWHHDEQGKNGHLHCDYIPVAHGFKKGLETQSALVKALNEMGYWTSSSKLTAQMMWQSNQNKYLEDLCKKYDLVVEHPTAEKQKHLNTKEYKQKQRMDENEQTINKQDQAIKLGENTITDQNKTITSQNQNIAKNDEVIEAQMAQMKADGLRKQIGQILSGKMNTPSITTSDYEIVTVRDGIMGKKKKVVQCDIDAFNKMKDDANINNTVKNLLEGNFYELERMISMLDAYKSQVKAQAEALKEKQERERVERQNKQLNDKLDLYRNAMGEIDNLQKDIACDYTIDVYTRQKICDAIENIIRPNRGDGGEFAYIPEV